MYLCCFYSVVREKNNEKWCTKCEKKAKNLTEQFPTSLYTESDCLEMIKSRDKDADALYVEVFEKEI